MTTYDPRRELLVACLTSTYLVLLCISGAHGLALVPSIALWTGVLALPGAPRNRNPSLWHRFILLALVVCVFSVVALYFRAFERVPYFPKTSGILHTLKTALQFLTMSFGPAVKSAWPLSGFLMAIFIVAGVLVLCVVIRRKPTERARAAGLLLFMAAMGTLSLAIGLGRNGFESRYITLAVPVLCALYVVFTLYLPREPARVASWALVLTACMCALTNTRSGLSYGSELRTHLGSFERNMEAGTLPFELVYKYAPYLHPNQQLVTDYLPLLQQAGIGSFRTLRNNPPFREIHLPFSPVLVRDASFSNGEGRTSSGNGQFVLQVPEPLEAAGIRVRFTVQNQRHTPPFFYIAWRADDKEFRTERSYYISPTGDHANWSRGTWLRINQPETETVVWICDRVRDLLIRPDADPCVFRILDVTLLVPQGAAK
jgi:hypothetical protein